MDHGQGPTQELIAGRYRPLDVVHEEPGRSVRLGEDIGLGRPVSLIGSWPAPAGPDDQVGRRATRILRASEAMELHCPGRVATVLDVVDTGGVLWLVTDRIEGTPLGSVLERGPVGVVRAARLGLGIVEVLEAAHHQGTTHGDLSPGQVFVRRDGGVVLTGFGLVGASVTQRLTAPAYASPEQARGTSAGPAADQWALGALLYAMVEGRPLFKDRGPVEATLRGVERLPLRSPTSAGPLAPAITGLLRRDARERVPMAVVRASLTRIVNEEVDEGAAGTSVPRWTEAWRLAHRAGGAWRRPAVRRSVLIGGGLVAAGCVAVLVTASGSDGGHDATAGPLPSRSGAGTAPAAPSAPTAAAPTATPSGGGATGRGASPSTTPPAPPAPVSPSPSRGGNPDAGFRTFVAPEGFSVDLPQGWSRIRTQKAAEGTYRITFGASGDPRTLAVTASVTSSTDPVAVWESVEPSLNSTYADYARVGDIRPVTYQGHPGADMEWLSTLDGVRSRTFGRGFLPGDGRGFSLRWTRPAAGAGSAADQQALKVILRTFRPTTG
ncbi:serine/threonine-protein kinase [Streptomyces sp. NPDC048664]|uniref:serine/threonine protein kinase n=1 Tax=Streptomyces sp. NPDC048664 TaxID=3154505 RepID=UPI003428F8B0